MYNNTQSNAIVYEASNISHMPLLDAADIGRWLQADEFTVLFMNELKNLPKTVPPTFCYFIDYNIIIVQVRCITTKSKEAARIGYNGFPFTHSYSVQRVGVRKIQN